MQRIVLASNNQGKLAELQAMFAPLGVALVRQADLHIGEADEPFHTFIENALAKARHAAAHCGLPSLADDSGICVHALGGAPGVHSARYAGEHASDDENLRLMLRELAEVPASQRGARYRCVIVMPETQSREKIDFLRMIGADLRLVPAKPFKDPGNYVHVSRRMAEEMQAVLAAIKDVETSLGQIRYRAEQSAALSESLTSATTAARSRTNEGSHRSTR